MKIAICCHFSLSFYGGGEKWAVQVANYLAKVGHDVAVYSFPLSPGGRKHSNPESLLDRVAYREGWWHPIDADVAYYLYHPLCDLNFPGPDFKVAGIHTQLYFLDSPPPLGYGMPQWAAYWTYRMMGTWDLARFDRVHILHPSLKVRHRDVVHSPNFVNTDLYHDRGILPSRFRVLLVGKATWQKGWDHCAEVAHTLRGHDIDFVWAGGSDQGTIKGLGFITSDQQMSEAYSSAHAMLYPTRVDMFSLAIVEALACGTPVITTTIPGHMSLGLELEFADSVQAMCQSVQRLKELWEEDPESYASLRSRCRRSALAYDQAQVLPQIEKLVCGVAEKTAE